MRRFIRLLLLFSLLAFFLYLVYQLASLVMDLRDPRSQAFVQWWRGERDDLIVVQSDACPGAPFILPSPGWIGLLYADPRGPYSDANPHQGIDIFSDGEPGVTPVYAAYDGYVTREPDWQSTLIMRVPDDPLNPGQQIWLYYTHMADREGNDFIEPAFEPGTYGTFVEQGTLLGYTGDYNGTSPRPIGTHLHFSIVRDDGRGRYLNELAFANTLDPSPYLGLAVNYQCPGAGSPGCDQ